MKILRRYFYGLALEQRILAAVMLIVGILILGIYLTIARTFAVLDESLVEHNLDVRMQQFVESYQERGNTIRMPYTSGFKGYMDQHPYSPPVPAAVARLPENKQTPVLIGNQYYQALHVTRSGRHFYLLLDTKQLESMKQFIVLTAIEFVSIAVIMSLAAARWLGRLISRPLTQLTDAVRNYNLTDEAPQKLGQRFRDNDMAAIAAAFDGFVTRLTEFVSREQAFTQDASHELRTPLTVILSSLQLLAEDKSIGVSGQLRLARIKRAAENMQALIDALLWLSREDAPATMPQTDLEALIQDLIQQMSEQLSRKPVTLEFQNLANYPRSVAKGMAASVIGNLLVNAMNHTDEGRIKVTLRDDRLEVHDTGHGIPPEDITHIFERRYRGSLSRGQGLGLYIVRRICNHLGWDVSVTSRPGAGTCFTIHFNYQS